MKQDHLLLIGQGFLHGLQELGGEVGFHLLFAGGLSGINDGNEGQSGRTKAFFKFHQPIFALLHIEVAFKGGGSRAQQGFGLVKVGEKDSRIPSVVPRGRVVLFVRRIVFFIHHNQAQVGKRQKQGRARPEDDGHPIQDRLPNFHPFVVVEFGVVDDNLVSKMLLKALYNLSRQGNFRQEVKHLLSFGHHLLHQFHKNLGFATARHPVQQHHIFFLKMGSGIGEGLFLGLRELEIGHHIARVAAQAADFFFINLKHPFVHQRLHHARSRFGPFGQGFAGHIVQFFAQLKVSH